MTIITTITNIFSKKASENLLSIAMQPENITYGYFPKDSNKPITDKPLFNSIKIHNDDVTTAFMQLNALPIHQSSCNIILSAKYYSIVQVDKPMLPENELRAALTWQIKDLVPIEPSDMVIDYFDAPALASKERINVVCASEKQLKSYIGGINQNNAKVNRIIPEEFGFAELISKSTDATLLLCQQPNEDLLILIVKNEQLFSYRRIRATANIGIRSSEELAAGFIDKLSIEMQKSIDYFERQLKQSPVKVIKVLLPIDKESFIARKLSENTLLPVELLTLPHPYNDQRSFAITMSSLIKSNLSHDAKIEEAIA